jgi:hypothetical protein
VPEWDLVLALLYGIAVRDVFATSFRRALRDLRRPPRTGPPAQGESVLRGAVATAGLDPDTVAEEAWAVR